MLVMAQLERPRQHWCPWHCSLPSRPQGMSRRSLPSSRITWMSAPVPPVSCVVSPRAVVTLPWFSCTRMSWECAGSVEREYYPGNKEGHIPTRSASFGVGSSLPRRGRNRKARGNALVVPHNFATVAGTRPSGGHRHEVGRRRMSVWTVYLGPSRSGSAEVRGGPRRTTIARRSPRSGCLPVLTTGAGTTPLAQC